MSWYWERETWDTLEGGEIGPRAHLVFFGADNDAVARWLRTMRLIAMQDDVLVHVAVPVERVGTVLEQLIQEGFRPSLVDLDRGSPPVDVEVISEVAAAIADVLGHDRRTRIEVGGAFASW